MRREVPPDARLRAIPSRMLSITAGIGRDLVAGRLAERDLRLGHYATLEILDARPGCAQRDVSEWTGHDPSDVVALVDDLSDRGYAVREVDPVDRRRRALRLTPEGEEVLAWARQQVRDATREFLSPLRAAERDQLLDLVGRLHAGHSLDEDAD